MPKVTGRCNAESDCQQLRCLYAFRIRTRHYQRLGIKGEIPKGATQVTMDPYVFRLVDGALKTVVGEIECRYCGQTSRLLSNRAVRPIARYYLSLSMPFADCPDPKCANHGINLFENWTSRSSRSARYYRRENEHLARCRACLRTFPVGNPFGVRTSC